MPTDNCCFYLQKRLIQTSQTGGQRYSDTSPFSIPCCADHYCVGANTEPATSIVSVVSPTGGPRNCHRRRSPQRPRRPETPTDPTPNGGSGSRRSVLLDGVADVFSSSWSVHPLTFASGEFFDPVKIS
jgi:hypothetical protein